MEELYKFETPDGDYHYCNVTYPVDYLGDTYTPVPVTRSSVIKSTASSSEEIFVISNFPIKENQLIKDIIAEKFEGKITLNIYRRRTVGGRTGVERMFIGKVSGAVLNGETADIESESRQKVVLEREVHNRMYQRQCPFIWSSAECGVDRNRYKTTTTVTSIDETGRIITLASINNIPALTGNAPDDWFTLGIMTRTANNAYRTIESQKGNRFILGHSFLNIAVGDEVEIAAGCDKRIATCYGKFNNDRFGGQTGIPNRNIARTGIQTNSRENASASAREIDNNGNLTQTRLR